MTDSTAIELRTLREKIEERDQIIAAQSNTIEKLEQSLRDVYLMIEEHNKTLVIIEERKERA